ncbi:MAG: hypothetical protein QOF02_2655 [Blastocatellia bacterium]|nr:hypothetical protein [Blastocatellia bacterium]
MRGGRAGLVEELADEAAQDEQGRAALARGDFDILPCDAAAPTCLQSLERGFFCGEACGIMLRGDRSATLAVSALGLCVHALKKARRAFYHFAHAMDFDDVYANGNNHG